MLSTILAAVCWLLGLLVIIRLLLGPRPIPGLAYNRIGFWLPLGDLISLGVHSFITQEVFDWFSIQCQHSTKGIIQLYVPSFTLTKPIIIINDLEQVKRIVTQRNRLLDRAPIMHELFGLVAPGASIGMRTDDKFRQQRRLWNCMVSPESLKTIIGPSLHKLTMQMLEVWQTRLERTPACAFQTDTDIRKTTLGAMWHATVGTDLDLFNTALSKSAYKRTIISSRDSSDCQRVYRALLDIFFCLDWMTLGISRPFYSWLFNHTYMLPRAQRIVDQALSDQINIARDRINSKHATRLCVLDTVLSKTAQPNSAQNPQHMSDEALKDELMELFITGHETTASSIQWALKYLADNQSTQLKLHQELLAAFSNVKSNGLPSAAAIMEERLPYLEAVVWETLRLSCTGPVSFRETTGDCELQGILVPAGIMVILVTSDPMLNRTSSTAKIIRSSESDDSMVDIETPSHGYNAPLSDFEPARWLRADGTFDWQACNVMPFSAGPRGCFGKQIALLELRITLAMIFLTFRLPKLPSKFSKYGSRDSLTRRPTCCYVMPELM